MEMKNVLDQLKAIAENNDSEDVARAIETVGNHQRPAVGSFKDRLAEAEFTSDPGDVITRSRNRQGPRQQEITGDQITNVEVEGIDSRDYPDFVDAYITYAEWADGSGELSEEELERIDPAVAQEEAMDNMMGQGDAYRDAQRDSMDEDMEADLARVSGDVTKNASQKAYRDRSAAYDKSMSGHYAHHDQDPVPDSWESGDGKHKKIAQAKPGQDRWNNTNVDQEKMKKNARNSMQEDGFNESPGEGDRGEKASNPRQGNDGSGRGYEDKDGFQDKDFSWVDKEREKRLKETPGDDDQYCALCGNTGYRLDQKGVPCPNCDEGDGELNQMTKNAGIEECGEGDAEEAFDRIADRVAARNGGGEGDMPDQGSDPWGIGDEEGGLDGDMDNDGVEDGLEEAPKNGSAVDRVIARDSRSGEGGPVDRVRDRHASRFAVIDEEMGKVFQTPMERHSWMMNQLSDMTSSMSPEDAAMVKRLLKTAGQADVKGGNC